MTQVPVRSRFAEAFFIDREFHGNLLQNDPLDSASFLTVSSITPCLHPADLTGFFHRLELDAARLKT
jgi:hypothetical protein